MEKEKQVRLNDEQVADLKARYEKAQLRYKNANEAKGFRKLTKGNKQKLSNQVQELAKQLADEFMARQKDLSVQFGMELRAEMHVDQYTQAAAPRLMLRPYVPSIRPETKKWHEAMRENLETRSKCEHVEHAEGGKCEKCVLEKYVEIDGTPVRAWGVNDKGITEEYRQHQLGLIEKERLAQEEADAEETEK